MFRQPRPGSSRNKHFLYTSGITRGRWAEQKLKYAENQINCLKKKVYIYKVVYFTLNQQRACEDYGMTFTLKGALPSSFW